MKPIYLGALAATLVFASCKKYDEGPAIQLTSRDSRMANTWVVEQATENNEDVTADYKQYELYLTEDGDAELDAEYTYFGTTIVADADGTWTFFNDDESVQFDYDDDDLDASYQILKLTEDELWLREIGEDLELHYSPK